MQAVLPLVRAWPFIVIRPTGTDKATQLVPASSSQSLREIKIGDTQSRRVGFISRNFCDTLPALVKLVSFSRSLAESVRGLSGSGERGPRDPPEPHTRSSSKRYYLYRSILGSRCTLHLQCAETGDCYRSHTAQTTDVRETTLHCRLHHSSAVTCQANYRATRPLASRLSLLDGCLLRNRIAISACKSRRENTRAATRSPLPTPAAHARCPTPASSG